MAAHEIRSIVMIGAGRLAMHLGLALRKQGLNIIQVCNRTPLRGQRLANRLGAAYTAHPEEIHQDADLCILAVSDSVLPVLAENLRPGNMLVVHVSGSVGMDVLYPISENVGVFYPLQTFSHRKQVDFTKIPICIEANSGLAVEKLVHLAGLLSQDVHLLDTEKRRMLHLGAVFVSNFTNFLYVLTEDLLKQHQVPFHLLEPLIMQTVKNIRHEDLFQYQTGPAVRGDMEVLEKHIQLLSEHPDYRAVYRLISDKIIKYKKIHGKL